MRGDAEIQVTPYPNGPYLVRGARALVDQEGNEIQLHRGTIALCRCGRSRLLPFCDGTHKSIGFRAPGAGVAAEAESPAQAARRARRALNGRVSVSNPAAKAQPDRDPGADGSLEDPERRQQRA